MAGPEIICERRGVAGWIVLDRPAALNALTHGMVRAITAALDLWEYDSAIHRVVIAGAGEKAFCAGGDLRLLYEQGRAGDHQPQMDFWFDEYRLNHRIKTYSKPFVALIDGIVMGGGVGVALHGSHRIAGERFMFAMPEVSIGFFPDVGASWFLLRLAGKLGAWAGLTGGRIRAGDACAFGLATAFVARPHWAALCDSLTAPGDTSAILAAQSEPPPPALLQAEQVLINHCFAPDSLAEIVARLDAAARGGSAFAAQAATAMRKNAPLSMAIALQQLARGAHLDFADALAMEYRIVARICRAHDFYEGVRALIVDKDQAPRWQPATLDAVYPGAVAAYFAPLIGAELHFGPVTGAQRL